MRHRELPWKIAVSIHQLRNPARGGEPGELRDAAPNGKARERKPMAILRPRCESAHEWPGRPVVVTQRLVERMLVGQPAHTPIGSEIRLGKDSGCGSSLFRIDLIRER